MGFRGCRRYGHNQPPRAAGIWEAAIPGSRASVEPDHSREIAEILEGFGDAYVAFDLDWCVVDCNASAETHFGLRREAMLGQRIWDVRPVAAESQLRTFLQEAMVARAPANAEMPSELHPGRWVALRAFPMGAGLGITFRDVTSRRERLRLGREQAARLELALATSGFGDWRWDMASDLVDLSPRAAEIVGAAPGSTMTWSAMLDHIHPQDREPARLAMAKALTTLGPYESEHRIERPSDGAHRWVMIRARPRLGDDGRLLGMLGVVTDVTEAKAAEARIRADRARLAELERRRAYLLEIADALRLIDDPDELLTTASRMMAERLNVTRMGYAEVGDDDRLHVRGEWTFGDVASLAGRSFVLEDFGPSLMGYLRRGLDLAVDDVRHDPRTASSIAAYASVQVRALILVPLVREGRLDAVMYAHHREPRAWSREDVALMEDVASRTWSALSRARVERQAAERQRLLINELNHRVKNTLATIQSLAHQTLREGVPIAEARERLTERLLALSTAHNVLTRENWGGADLTEIAREAVRPFDDPAGERIAMSGPRARLPPNVALALSMALHELATNAVKYGALSAPGGRVTLRWALDPAGEAMELEWRETGGPRASPPTSKGFGSRLISSLAGELGAPAALVYAPEGVTCRLRVPIA